MPVVCVVLHAVDLLLVELAGPGKGRVDREGAVVAFETSVVVEVGKVGRILLLAAVDVLVEGDRHPRAPVEELVHDGRTRREHGGHLLLHTARIGSEDDLGVPAHGLEEVSGVSGERGLVDTS